MARKPLFGDLIAVHEGLTDELKAVDVAADLTLLLNHAGVSRADLARASWGGAGRGCRRCFQGKRARPGSTYMQYAF